jgi:sterol desaturase/sphingolipid hydroxylase (fatty acid hydroxylase superfamily)
MKDHYWFHWLSIDRFYGKFSEELLKSIPVICGLFILEFILLKKQSSLYKLFKNPKLFRLDFLSFFLYFSGFKKGIANLFLLGFIGYITQDLLKSYDLPLIRPFLPSIGWEIFVILLYDLGTYWLHRLRHKFDLLWIHHSFHHSAEVLNPMTNFRQHPIDYLSFFFLFLLPFSILFEVSIYYFPLLFIIADIIESAAHSNLTILNNGLYAKIFVSPAVHRLHHSRNEKKHDKNFGNIFIFWDKLFNTYEEPIEKEGDWFKKYPTGLKGFNEIEAPMLNYFFSIFRDTYIHLRSLILRK